MKIAFLFSGQGAQYPGMMKDLYGSEPAAKKVFDQRSAASGARPTPTVQTSRPIPSMQRREPVTDSRSFPKPEAYCVSCEASGDDHFVRDRKRRIAQLDDWLKNGLIDREEYRVLKYRFERDQ